jgi:nanoRNase/pAp phosphatase (c-di-AMP/oligoRNAs hydrolase)
MALTIEQQISNLLREHNSVLICLPAKPTTDAIASGLAMYSVLQKLGKQAKVVAAGFALPDNHKFLPKSDEIVHELSALKKFVISVDVAQTSVQDIQYDIRDQRLNVYITPKQGYLDTRNVSTSSTDYIFDLVIVLDSRDLASLGKVFEDNAEFFHHTPMMNIDHHPANEHFGEINLVKVTATSISEMIFELLEHLDSGELLDEYIATQLLTGIISKTKSFKTNAVTPRSLAIASHLIASGARREEIVKNLYQTKTMSALKLWGRALSKLQGDTDRKLVWSVLQESDFTETGTTPLELGQVIDELIINTPDAQNVYIIYQTDRTVHAVIATAPYIHVNEVFRDCQPQGDQNFTYLTIPVSSLETAQRLVFDRLHPLVR